MKIEAYNSISWVSENKKICTALEILNQTQTGIVLVINRDQRLIGTLTDGDIRRGLLKGKVLDDFVTEIMNKETSYLSRGGKFITHVPQVMIFS